MEAIRVLHIISGLGVGGAETTLFNLLANMNSARFAPTVVSLGERGAIGERIERLGVRVHELRMHTVKEFPLSFLRLGKLVRSLHPQIIQGWMYHGNFIAALAGMLTPAGVAWNVRHTPYNLRTEKKLTALIILLCARLSSRTEGIIYNSMVSASRHEAMGYVAQRSVVIPNGFDVIRFAPSVSARALLRRELGISEESLLLGLIANFRPIKDHRTFLQAAAILARKHKGLRFVLAGMGVEHRNDLLSRMVDEHGIADRTHLLGPRADIPMVTAALDVAVSSSWSEGFSNSIAEGMACGVPCVATDVGDSARIIGRGEAVVPPRDPEALARALDNVLSLDPQERMRLGEQARRRVMDNFSMAAMIQDYERVYERIRASSFGIRSSKRVAGAGARF